MKHRLLDRVASGVTMLSYIYLDYFVPKIILPKILNNLRRKYVLIFFFLKKMYFQISK